MPSWLVHGHLTFTFYYTNYAAAQGQIVGLCKDCAVSSFCKQTEHVCWKGEKQGDKIQAQHSA